MDLKRNTVQRQLILKAVRKLNAHATAEEVYECVVQSHPTISKATVYRNMKQLSESGELVNVGSFYGSTRYDHICDEHYHFICEDCKRLTDVEGDFTDVVKKVKNMDTFEIQNCRLLFSGICPECKTSAASV